MKKKLAVLLAAALTLGMTACGASKGAGDTGKSEKSMVYAVEAGSAGEEAAKGKDRIWLLISIRCLLTLIKTEAWKKLPKPTVFRKHL